MKNALDDKESVRRFLLGSVSDTERAEIEDGFLVSDDAYQELLIAEDDLIDAHARGELSASESNLFARKLLTSSRLRERVEFAQILRKSISGKNVAAALAHTPDTAKSWWRSLFESSFLSRPTFAFTSAVTATLVIALGSLWVWTNREQPLVATKQQAQITTPTPEALGSPTASHESSAPIQIAEQHQPQQQTTRDAVKPKPAPVKKAIPVVATFTLLPGAVRSEGNVSPLVLPASANKVRLRLMLESDDYERYRATLSTPEGSRLWVGIIADENPNNSAHLNLNLPAKLLKPGDYVLSLGGANSDRQWESVTDYSFRIVRK